MHEKLDALVGEITYHEWIKIAKSCETYPDYINRDIEKAQRLDMLEVKNQPTLFKKGDVNG